TSCTSSTHRDLRCCCRARERDESAGWLPLGCLVVRREAEVDSGAREPQVRTQPLDRPGPASRPRHPSRGDSRVNLTARLLSLWPTAPETSEDPQYSQQR